MTIKLIVFHLLLIRQIIWIDSSLYLFIKNSWNQTCFICRVSMCNVIINSAYLIHTHVADKLPFTYHILFWRHGPEAPPRFYFGNSIKKIKCFRFRFVPDVSFFFFRLWRALFKTRRRNAAEEIKLHRNISRFMLLGKTLSTCFTVVFSVSLMADLRVGDVVWRSV